MTWVTAPETVTARLPSSRALLLGCTTRTPSPLWRCRRPHPQPTATHSYSDICVKVATTCLAACDQSSRLVCSAMNVSLIILLLLIVSSWLISPMGSSVISRPLVVAAYLTMLYTYCKRLLRQSYIGVKH